MSLAYINKAFWLAPCSIAKTLSSLSCVMWPVEDNNILASRTNKATCSELKVCLTKNKYMLGLVQNYYLKD